jgi:aminotransferase
MFLLQQTGVASVPGEAFCSWVGGKDLVRFCFAKTEEELERAYCRLKQLSHRKWTSQHNLPPSCSSERV